ncbi:MAG: hypothetical protein QOJ99_4700, partial [Bryobacterales bacterium]|nr:hypothetical protein [Bryobacterales bacterium]
MPLLWMALRIIFRVNFCVDYAGRRSRVIGGGSPHAIHQFQAAACFERDAAPVIRRSRRLQPAFTFSTELTAPLFVPPQPVRAEQAVAIVIHSQNGPSALHSRVHNLVNILSPPRLRSRNAPHS